MEPIRNYLLIGDLHTSALVSSRGSIDWLCLPVFDSPSVFASILDEEKGGSLRIDDREYRTEAGYLKDTAIVETVFTGKQSSFAIRDFMLPRPTEEVVAHFLVRKVIGKKGRSRVRFILDARPKYAKQRVLFRRRDDTLYRARLGERSLWLHLPKGAIVHYREDGSIFEIELEVEKGETKDIILEYSLESRLRLQGRDLEAETRAFWKEWVAKGTFFAYSKDELIRSAITLKLMQFYPTGGLIAAPTTSLPEKLGGERNWDYRYVWLRDATFTLYAFSVLGFTEEAKKFFRFIEEVCEEMRECEGDDCDIDVPVMFTIWGGKIRKEETLEHLRGYGDSRPVRIGNGASEQQQLDIYGSLIDAYYFMEKLGVPISKKGRDIIALLVRKIAKHWKEKDNGIWEVRSGIQHFTYSKVMGWVGLDRALMLAEKLKIFSGQKEEWKKLKAEIEEWIWENCFDEKRGTFVQRTGNERQDATNFLFVLFRFLDRNDGRTKQIVRSTMKELCFDDLYVYRYHAADGLPGREGAFVLCTFWLIATLAAIGEIAHAEKMFKAFSKAIAPHGLIAEEIDPKSGDYLGNYPQGFSHIGCIMSAFYIHKYKGRNKTK